jgi:oligopeptide/dipeptide ABC transporter ATP-binding protein
MRQRVVVATALANDPALLIADAPTTALDVTIQAQILDLLLSLRDRHGTAILLITHDLGVVAQICDRVAVMYAGQLVELAPARELFRAPRHPYTQALLAAQPTSGQRRGALRVIPGEVADLTDPPPGCRFAPRCPLVFEACTTTPALEPAGPGHVVACWAAERASERPSAMAAQPLAAQPLEARS